MTTNTKCWFETNTIITLRQIQQNEVSWCHKNHNVPTRPQYSVRYLPTTATGTISEQKGGSFPTTRRLPKRVTEFSIHAKNEIYTKQYKTLLHLKSKIGWWKTCTNLTEQQKISVLLTLWVILPFPDPILGGKVDWTLNPRYQINMSQTKIIIAKLCYCIFCWNLDLYITYIPIMQCTHYQLQYIRDLEMC